MDVCGPLEKKSNGGSRFFATFMYDYSKLKIRAKLLLSISLSPYTLRPSLRKDSLGV
jgi:hypothetical protein